MPDIDLDGMLALLEAADDLTSKEKFKLFSAYGPQIEFFALGSAKRERLFMAGNQCGKTMAGAYEMCCHLTGIYPSWWPGRKFSHPIRAWAGGEGGAIVRDKMQGELCGGMPDTEEWGTGLLPPDLLTGRALAHGVTGLCDHIRVKHVSGGTSRLSFKTYDQGRAKWQSETLDVIWVDEEPPDDVYGEASTRLTGRGLIYVTCTPLNGPTDFIKRFTEPANAEQARTHGVARMGLRHANHFSEEEKADRLAGYPAHERAARENGDPVLEGGVIFRTPELDIKLATGPKFLHLIPPHWGLLWGIDFGFGHPFAAALCAFDKDADVFYVLHTIRMTGAVPVMHADAMKRVAINVPVAWPHDGTHTEKGAGEKLSDIYRKQRLNMLNAHATHGGQGGYEVWPGLTEMDVFMRAGRFKVAETCLEFFDEYRTYRSETTRDGTIKIIKIHDDVLDAVRCAFMMRRMARNVPLGDRPAPRRPAGFVLPGASEEHFGY